MPLTYKNIFFKMIYAVVLTIIALAFILALALSPTAVEEIRLYRRRGKFKCLMCSNCCRFRVIPITKEDIKRLEDAGYKDFYVGGDEVRIKRINGRCMFLKDDRCSVHEKRPDVCRSFPFFRLYGVGYAQKLSFCPAMEKLKNE
jgi:Fe-S-cluster containining protein